MKVSYEYDQDPRYGWASIDVGDRKEALIIVHSAGGSRGYKFDGESMKPTCICAAYSSNECSCPDLIFPTAPETALLARLEALEAENARLLTVIADAIRRPMGVVPNSADGLLTQADLERAEQRRVHRSRK